MLNKEKIIVEFLTAKGIINVDQINKARQLQMQTHQRIDNVFKELNIFCDEHLKSLIVQEQGLSFLDPFEFSPDSDIIESLDPFFAQRFRVVPLSRQLDRLIIAFLPLLLCV